MHFPVAYYQPASCMLNVAQRVPLKRAPMLAKIGVTYNPISAPAPVFCRFLVVFSAENSSFDDSLCITSPECFPLRPPTPGPFPSPAAYAALLPSHAPPARLPTGATALGPHPPSGFQRLPRPLLFHCCARRPLCCACAH